MRRLVMMIGATGCRATPRAHDGVECGRRAWDREATVEVAVEADSEAFFGRFLERVGRLAQERRSALA